MRKLHHEGWASTSQGNNGRFKRRKEPRRDCLLHCLHINFVWNGSDKLSKCYGLYSTFNGRDEGRPFKFRFQKPSLVVPFFLGTPPVFPSHFSPCKFSSVKTQEFLEKDSLLTSLDVSGSRWRSYRNTMGRILPGCYGLSHVCTCVSHYVYMFLINTYRERERDSIFTSRDFHNPCFHLDVPVNWQPRSSNCLTSEGISTLLPACSKLQRLDPGVWYGWIRAWDRMKGCKWNWNERWNYDWLKPTGRQRMLFFEFQDKKNWEIGRGWQ